MSHIYSIFIETMNLKGMQRLATYIKRPAILGVGTWFQREHVGLLLNQNIMLMSNQFL